MADSSGWSSGGGPVAVIPSASQGSASSGLGGSAGVEVRGSPVPYRIGPFDYKPPAYCDYNLKAPRWISWSTDNPGRRYHRCPRANTSQDCMRFDWVDGTISKWYKGLLLDLKGVVEKLKKERGEAVVDEDREQHFLEIQEMNHSLQRQLVLMDAQIVGKDTEMKKKDELLLKKVTELQAKQQELDNLKVNMQGRRIGFSSLCVCSCVFVVGILFAMLFNAIATYVGNINNGSVARLCLGE